MDELEKEVAAAIGALENNAAASTTKSMDLEDLLQRVLSILADTPCPHKDLQPDRFDRLLLVVTQDPNKSSNSSAEDATTTAPNDASQSLTFNECHRSLRLLDQLKTVVGPFDFHTCIYYYSVRSYYSEDDNEEGAAAVLFRLRIAVALASNLSRMPPAEKRLKRWMTMLWETLSVFPFHSFESTIALPARVGTVAWKDHVYPHSSKLLQLILDKHIGNDFRWCPSAFRAVAVSITSSLIHMEFMEDGMSPTIQNLVQLYTEIAAENLSTLLLYPSLAQLNTGLSTKEDMNSSDLCYWILGGDDDRPELVSSCHTQLTMLSISISSALVFQRRVFPTHWSPTALWEHFFPHVPVLLYDSDNECPTERNLQRLGLGLLEDILSLVPSKSQSLPLHMDGSPNPLGTFQLLSHYMVIASISNDSSESICSSKKAFGLIRELLYQYLEPDQVRLVEQLVNDCPHPGLVPKFIDLLRSFIQWKSEEATQAVVCFVNRHLSELFEKFLVHHSSLREIGDLIQHSEIYVSILGLCQIGRTAHPVLLDSSRLKLLGELRGAINKSMNDGKNTAIPQLHRLLLLEYTIGLLLEDDSSCMPEHC